MIRECSAQVAADGGASGMYSVPYGAPRVNVRGGPLPGVLTKQVGMPNVRHGRRSFGASSCITARSQPMIRPGLGYAAQDVLFFLDRAAPEFSQATCLSGVGSFLANAPALPADRSCCPSIRPKSSINLATIPVQPVWWLAPRPAPLSPWKYS